MRSLVASLLALLLSTTPTFAEPPVPTAKKAGVSAERHAAQVLGVAAVALVIGGTASFAAALGEYDKVRSGCGAERACTPADLEPGKVAQWTGWALAGAGVLAGLSAVLFARSDARGETRQVTLAPMGTGIAVSGRF